MIALIVVLAVVVAFFGTLLWAISRSKPNEASTLGSNSPFAGWQGTSVPGRYEGPYYSDAILSDDELFRRDADRRVSPASVVSELDDALRLHLAL